MWGFCQPVPAASGVVRSLHPTHSLAARGRDAAAFVEGEELRETACPRNGCYGRLYDRGAKILFLGCRLTSNTYLHGVEEWCGVPERITDTYEQLYIRLPWGGTMERPMRRHYHPRGVDISGQYGKRSLHFWPKGSHTKEWWATPSAPCATPGEWQT